MRAFAPARIVSAATSTSPAVTGDGERSVRTRAVEKLRVLDPTAVGAPFGGVGCACASGDSGDEQGARERHSERDPGGTRACPWMFV